MHSLRCILFNAFHPVFHWQPWKLIKSVVLFPFFFIHSFVSLNTAGISGQKKNLCMYITFHAYMHVLYSIAAHNTVDKQINRFQNSKSSFVYFNMLMHHKKCLNTWYLSVWNITPVYLHFNAIFRFHDKNQH